MTSDLENGKNRVPQTEEQQRLGFKLEDIFADPELAWTIGHILVQLSLPNLVQQGKITKGQAVDLGNTYSRTLDSTLTTEQRERIEKEEEHNAWRDEHRRLKGLPPKRSPFDLRVDNS